MTKLELLKKQKREEAFALKLRNNGKSIRVQSSGNVKTSWSKACNINTLIDCGHLNYNCSAKTPKPSK